MEFPVCRYCGAPLVTVRADAKYCTTKCRVYASRARARRTLPTEMTRRARWMRWDLRPRRGKTTKVPLTADGGAGSSTDEATWCGFDTARAATVGRGLGFALGDGIGCIDLDHALVNGKPAGWAQEILDACPATYVEVSQSGEGLHIFGLLPPSHGRVIRDGARSVEVYSAGRYIAVTGDRFTDAPAVLADLSGMVSAI